MQEVLAGDALEQAALIAGGRISAEALMQATLERIGALNPRVNAIVSLRPAEDLLAEARAADAALQAGGRKGWMHGLPLAIKDLEDAAGLPTSKGSPLLAGQVAAADSLMVARMRAAGAIIIGKTNTPEFGLGSHTFNPVHGATGNAWDPARSAGGSSGGAAVALALGMLPVADGSDMMGSLRNPAGWNHVYGMRPSWGRVPDGPGEESFLHPLSTNGPMARSPRDLAALLEVQSGPHPAMPYGLPKERFLNRIATPVAGRRIAWLGDWGGAYPMDPGILDTCAAAMELWPQTGVRVDAVAPPFDPALLWRSWCVLRGFAVAGRLGPLYDAPEKRAQLKPAAIWEVESGRSYSTEDIRAAGLIRSHWYARAAELLSDYDAFALPSAQLWPFDRGVVHPQAIGARATDTYHRWMEVVVPASLIGLPAISLPAGFGAQGLPIGVQIVGRHGDDAGLLQLAQAWHPMRPAADAVPALLQPLAGG